jgi:Ribonuclease G/E
VNPSLTIKERFKLDDFQDVPNLLINDRRDRQGIKAFGDNRSIESLWTFLHESFEDVITRRWNVCINGIYKGLIKGIDPKTNFLLVDLGSTIGIVQAHERINTSKKEILVQVEGKRLGSKHPLLTTEIKLIGKNAILIPTPKIGVSFRIQNSQKREELYKLGKELATKNWGIIWRSTSVKETKETLQNEVQTLIQQGELLHKKAETAVAPTLIVDGTYFMDAEFPTLSKEKLDELRSKVTPTLQGHHYYKTCSGKIAAELELAEKMLKKGILEEEVKELFCKIVKAEYPKIGSLIKVQHVKLNGKILYLGGEAILEKFDNTTICFRRFFHKAGVYNGLGVLKEPEDYAITETQIGAWHTETNYYSREGHLKGTYVNINTPIEVYCDRIRYVDLEVDICLLPNRVCHIIDMEKLEQAFLKGFISKKLLEIVKTKVEELTEKYGYIKKQ